ncbi:MAG: PIG-L family deacetylase [Peptococcaceae bacterium]|nr:PIG-L family deacetylase [Peptococcaceae bacterium]
MFIGFKTRIALLLLAIIFLITVPMFLAHDTIVNHLMRSALSDIEIPGKDARVLVFSPHNDDEVLGPGELIKKSLQNKAQVKVVLITNGDGYKTAVEFDYLDLNPKPEDYVKFGYLRQKESAEAMKKMGLSQENIIFLGYPDGGISYLWNSFWDPNHPYTSNFTQTNKSPYKNSYRKNAPYAGESLAEDIIKIIKEYQPTHIVFPHPSDNHPDHWGTNSFVKYAMTKINYKPDFEWLYLVHSAYWPTPTSKNSSLFLVPPRKLINLGTKWFAMDINREDIKEKTGAIELYKSQMRTLGLAMASFERKNELFGVYPNIPLVKYKIPELNVQPSPDNLVIKDPLQDAFRIKMDTSADLVGLYAEIPSDSNKLCLMLETHEPVGRDITYLINVIVFEENHVSRLRLKILDNKVSAIPLSSQTIFDTGKVSLDIKDNIIQVFLPFDNEIAFSHLYLDAESTVDDHLIDKTPWRMVNASNSLIQLPGSR